MIEHARCEEQGAPGSDLRSELQALRRAASERRWHDFIRNLPRNIEGFQLAAEAVETCWHDLSDDNQDLILWLKDECRSMIDASPTPNIIEAAKSRLAGTSDDERRKLRRLFSAIGAFIAVVDHRLREEKRVRDLLDKAMREDADVTAEIARGTAEAKASAGHALDAEEFRARFG